MSNATQHSIQNSVNPDTKKIIKYPNIASKYVMSNMYEGNLRTRIGQIISYAVDFVLVTKTGLENMIREVTEEGKKWIQNNDTTIITKFNKLRTNRKNI